MILRDVPRGEERISLAHPFVVEVYVCWTLHTKQKAIFLVQRQLCAQQDATVPYGKEKGE